MGRLKASLLASDEPEEPEWRVGGRYKVLRGGMPVFADAQLAGERLGELKAKDAVLLLEIRSCASVDVGLVVPPPPEQPGWVELRAVASEPGPALQRRQLEGSWAMRARYMVKNPATLRADASLASDWVGEVMPGDEVLVLELGLGAAEDGGQVRLRALVRTDAGLIGWLSPETSGGDRLLYPVNLLGPQVVDIHRKSLVGGSSPPRSSIRSVGAGGNQDGPWPWEAGGKYRILERLALREALALDSKEVGKLSAGCIVSATDIQSVECPMLGRCPCAFVTADDGPEAGKSGWVRCAAKDGHDLIDTRDQLEFDKVVQQLRVSQQQATATAQPPGHRGPEAASARGDETSNTASARSSASSATGSRASEEEPETNGKPAEMSFPKAPSALKTSREVAEAEAFAGAMRHLEECREDRPIQEMGSIEERSYANCCGCGGRS